MEIKTSFFNSITRIFNKKPETATLHKVKDLSVSIQSIAQQQIPAVQVEETNKAKSEQSRLGRLVQKIKNGCHSTLATCQKHPVITAVILTAIAAGIIRTFLELRTERRATVDAGSGAIKVYVADVYTKSNQVKKVLFNEAFPVPLQKALAASPDKKSVPGEMASPDTSFEGGIQEHLVGTFKNIREKFNELGVKKVRAVATEAYRQADQDGPRIVDTIRKWTGIPLTIVSQDQEGHIAFECAVAKAGTDSKKTIVWDIGTGSHQMTHKTEDDQYDVFKKGMGAVPFKNFVISKIQGKDPQIIKTPNPITEENRQKALEFGKNLASQATPSLLEKVKTANVLGIGGLFKNSILTRVNDPKEIHLSKLQDVTTSLLNKTDQELNSPFADTQVSNCMQVESLMKAFGISKVRVVDTSTAEGMLYGDKQKFSSFVPFKGK
jgi:exopolyphosphatase/pppGpp-phosphohydrolase